MSLRKVAPPTAYILLIIVGLIFVIVSLAIGLPVSYSDLRTVLTTTTATFGTLLGIITAGLMFTHGKFSELESAINEKLPYYLDELLSMEKIQLVMTHLLSIRKTFMSLAANTEILAEKSLYTRVVSKATSMFVRFAVILNLKLAKKGLSHFVSEMDPKLYKTYQEERKSITKEWQIMKVTSQIMDDWEAPTILHTGKIERSSALQADLKNALSILGVKEKIETNLSATRAETEEALDSVSANMDRINDRLHEDGIRQLMSQMEHACTIRGKYFYLALMFIAAPLFINLLILPQFSESTFSFLRYIILVTSFLSVMGVIFLLVYIRNILTG